MLYFTTTNVWYLRHQQDYGRTIVLEKKMVSRSIPSRWALGHMTLVIWNWCPVAYWHIVLYIPSTSEVWNCGFIWCSRSS